jgi:phosphoribosyl 1,2-cyclic phosphodiesterase
MEVHNLIRWLKTNIDDNTKRIILTHLSAQNADAATFQSEVAAMGIPTMVAKNGMYIGIHKLYGKR